MSNQFEKSDRLVDREVVCCASVLISDLQTLTAPISYKDWCELSFDEDDLLTLAGKDDYSEPVEYEISKLEREKVVEYLEDRGFDVKDDEPVEKLREAMWEDIQSDGDEYIRAYAEDNDIEPYQREAYEFWVVTRWLYDRLEEKGEIVGEVCNLKIWGRCTTGQSISMDSVICQIAEETYTDA